MNIFVGNLPYRLSDEELRSLFEEHGSVDSARQIMERDTGKARGFGFVEMPNDNEAQSAIDALNEFEVMGRKLIVNKARPRGER